MQPEPLIVDLKGNSLDDGPGIRTVVFFKGCPLSCAWCHNPEARGLGAELAFEAARCEAVGACVAACPPGALDRNLEGFVDRERCTRCFDCVPACPTGALSKVGAPRAVDELVAACLKDRVFFRASGGGVTLSGGEPALFAPFAGELARRLREEKVHVLLETCGQFDRGLFDQHLYPHLDQIYFDLKLADDALHRRFCGTSNAGILANFRELWRRAQAGGVPVLPRIPLVPGATDSDENLRAWAALCRELAVPKLALLPYNPLWPDKLRKLGDAPSALLPADRRWMPPQELERCKALFSGLEVLGG